MCNNGIGLNDNETLNSIYKNVNIKLLLDIYKHLIFCC